MPSALTQQLYQSMTLPVMAAPMFIVSNPALVIAQCASGIIGSVPALNARPQEKLKDWLDEIDDTLALARDGTYGRLKRGSMIQAESARDKIAKLLEGHENAMELPPEERIELYNAQETIVAMIRSDDKGRMVCKKEIRLGSRMPTTECLTVAQREEKARGARDGANDTLRNVCVLGEGQPCSR